MSKARTLETAVDERREFEAAIDDCLAEMARVEKRMTRRQAAIGRLKADTRTLLAALEASV